MKIQLLLLLLALTMALRIQDSEEESEIEEEEAVDPLAWDIFTAHNTARTDPKSIATILQGQIQYFDGFTLWLPDKPGKITVEGPNLWKEAINFLNNQNPVPTIGWDDKLAKAAQDHATDLGKNAMTGHIGSDKSTPAQRIMRYGSPNTFAAENIACGATAGMDVVTQLIIDDDVPNRAHRFTVYNPAIKLAGVFCGPHPTFRTCCIIDYVDDWYKGDQ